MQAINGKSNRTDLLAAAIIASLFILCALTLSLLGSSSRSKFRFMAPRTPEFVFVETSEEAFAAMNERGMRGRRLLCISRFMHYVPEDPGISGGGFPVETFDLPEQYQKQISSRNLLWVAMKSNMAREVVHMMPPDAFNEKKLQISPKNTVYYGKSSVLLDDLGSLRFISSDIPTNMDEPLVTIVDASYLDLVDVVEVAGVIARLNTDLIVLNQARDNPDVSTEGKWRSLQLNAMIPGIYKK